MSREIGNGRIAVRLIEWSLLVALAMAAPAPAQPIFRLLVLGDSIAAGYGLAPGQSFPARLEHNLKDAGLSVHVIDDSVSGDTSAGGLARVGDALARRPDAVLLELGGNDALRATDPQTTYANLDRILTRFEAAGLPVLILGMRAPANWGTDYQRRFDAIYPRLAAAHHDLLYPFLLDGVALDPKYNQADLIHPNAAGADLIAHRLVPDVLRLISESKKAP